MLNLCIIAIQVYDDFMSPTTVKMLRSASKVPSIFVWFYPNVGFLDRFS